MLHAALSQQQQQQQKQQQQWRCKNFGNIFATHYVACQAFYRAYFSIFARGVATAKGACPLLLLLGSDTATAYGNMLAWQQELKKKKTANNNNKKKEEALCSRLFLLMLLAHVAALLVIYFLAARKDNGATAQPYARQLCPSMCVCVCVSVASGATSSNSHKKYNKKTSQRGKVKQRRRSTFPNGIGREGERRERGGKRYGEVAALISAF